MSWQEEVTVLSLKTLLQLPQSVTWKFPQTHHTARVELMPSHLPYTLPKFQHNFNVKTKETVNISHTLKPHFICPYNTLILRNSTAAQLPNKADLCRNLLNGLLYAKPALRTRMFSFNPKYST